MRSVPSTSFGQDETLQVAGLAAGQTEELAIRAPRMLIHAPLDQTQEVGFARREATPQDRVRISEGQRVPEERRQLDQETDPSPEIVRTPESRGRHSRAGERIATMRARTPPGASGSTDAPQLRSFAS